MGATDKRTDPVPFLAIGNVAVGVIAIGNVACGVVAIGATAACGVVAIGINAVGLVGLGVNAAGPFAGAIVNAVGVVALAGVNAIGGIGAGLVNAAVTPGAGIALAVLGFVLATKRAARTRPAPPVDASLTPLAQLREVPPGTYDVLATVERGELVDGGTRVPVEAADAQLAGKRRRWSLSVDETFGDAEGDYRSAPDKQRRYVLRGARAVPPRVWTRADLTHVIARALQLGTLASGGACAVVLAT